MGVYIDMEMPQSCLECRLYNDPWCMARNRDQWRTAYNRPQNGERQNDCPLVHVPPHGDLIDRDPFIEFIKTHWDSYDQWFAEQLEARPTIIPAEEGE